MASKLTVLFIATMLVSVTSLSLMSHAIRIGGYCNEDYSNVNDLPHACDATNAFINTLVAGTPASYSPVGVYISKPSPIMWRTLAASGISYWPQDHVDDMDYAVFVGHGSGDYSTNHYIVFNQTAYDTNFGISTSWVPLDITSSTYPDMYIHESGLLPSSPEWVALASCTTLDYYNETTGSTNYSGVVDAVYQTFMGNQFIFYNVDLHGILGMRTEWLDSYTTFYGLITVDTATPTLSQFATEMVNGANITQAWFDAVRDNQRICVGPWCTWEGKGAYITFKVTIRNPDWSIYQIYDYRKETYVTGTATFSDPSDILSWAISNGKYWQVDILYGYMP